MAQNPIGFVNQSASMLIVHMSLRDAYLSCYNGVQLCAWSIVLVRAVLAAQQNGDYRSVFMTSYIDLTIAQALTALETMHALCGIVKSPVMANALQFAGRTHALAVTLLLPELQRTPASAALVFTWAGSDVVRYSYGLGSVVAKSPLAGRRRWYSALTWLRYSLFIVMYPCGALAEAALLYDALPASKRGWGRVSMPNAWNFSWDYHAFLIVVLLAYAPLFLQLYTHMLRQRRKKLKAE